MYSEKKFDSEITNSLAENSVSNDKTGYFIKVDAAVLDYIIQVVTKIVGGSLYKTFTVEELNNTGEVKVDIKQRPLVTSILKRINQFLKLHGKYRGMEAYAGPEGNSIIFGGWVDPG